MNSLAQPEMPILVWFGRLFSHNGYGSGAQMHVAALRSEGVPVVAIDIETRNVVGPLPDGLVHIERRAPAISVSAVDPDRRITAVVHDRPDTFPHFKAAGRSRLIGYSYWETTTLPAEWSGLLSSMDRVWTSSEFNRDGFAASGVPRWMIDTVGHPVDKTLHAIATSDASYRDRWPEKTVFLSVVSSTVGRRDLSLLFEAYASAFGANDDVALVLKVPPAAAERTARIIQQVMLTTPARGSGQWPTVYTIGAKLSREQLVRLHASVDCYVSCERGDGWDLPSMDSMILGVPVVATDFGASSTFLQEDDCYLIPTSTTMVRCDDILASPHPLYSGQFWPYVDPGEIATMMKAAHHDVADRERRGKAAQARMMRRYEQRRVVDEVVELVSSGTEVDYRSNDAGVVTLSKWASQWQPPAGGSKVNKHPRVLEARLVQRLADDFMTSRNPRTALAAYKAASRFAASHPALDGVPIRSEISRVMAARSPLAKVQGLRSLRERVPSHVERFGGPEALRNIVAAADDYRATLTGADSAYSPAESEQMRRTLWASGPFISPSEDLQRLAELRNRHAGERVFILGNGPSLTKCDLSLLQNESTFGVNKIYLLFPKIDWRPTYYTLLDWRMGQAISDEVALLDGITKFFPERFRGVLPSSDETYWYWPRQIGSHVDDQFEPDMVRGIPSRATVLVTAIQQAFHLGFRDIYLIGVDASYTIPESVIQTGPDRFKTGVKLFLESTADDDANHFDPTYFGKGSHWHDPNVSDMRRLFRIMRKGVERHGGRLMNASVGGELEELERVDYSSLFDG